MVPAPQRHLRSSAAEAKRHRSHVVRAMYIVLGGIALLLAVLGIFLPVLPTTPFVLLAAACFARSSERLHRYLLAQRQIGPIIHAWEAHRAMPPGVKPWAYALMAVSFGVSILLMDSPWHRGMLAVFALVLAVLLWRVPVRPRPMAAPKKHDAP